MDTKTVTEIERELIPNQTSKNAKKGGIAAAKVIVGSIITLVVANNPELAPFAKAAVVVGTGLLGFVFGFVRNRIKKHYKDAG